MNLNFKTTLLLLASCYWLGCQSIEQPQEAKETSPFAQISDTPTLLAPAIISTKNPEFASTFTPDGKTIYFNRTNADRSEIELYESHWKQEKWTSPQLVSFAKTEYKDLDPFINHDGSKMYFSSLRPMMGWEEEDFSLWVAEKKDTVWSEPYPLDTMVNSPEDEIFCSTARNGNIYFRATTLSGDYRAIHKAVWKNGKYQKAERLEFEMEDSIRVGNPCIAPDESFMILAIANAGGEGDADLFVSFSLENGKWSAVENLGTPINSKHSDFAPFITPDGEYLFYTSERGGIVEEGAVEGRPPGDIYGVKLPQLSKK